MAEGDRTWFVNLGEHDDVTIRIYAKPNPRFELWNTKTDDVESVEIPADVAKDIWYLAEKWNPAPNPRKVKL